MAYFVRVTDEKDVLAKFPNARGEPVCKLGVEPGGYPGWIVFKSNQLFFKRVYTDIKLTNNTGKRQGYVFRATANWIFHVHPPKGYLENKQTFIVRLSCGIKELEPCLHYFTILHFTAEDRSLPIQAAVDRIYAKKGAFEGLRRMPIQFQREDGNPYGPEETYGYNTEDLNNFYFGPKCKDPPKHTAPYLTESRYLEEVFAPKKPKEITKDQKKVAKR